MSTVRPRAHYFPLLDALDGTASQRNALLLVQLRWMAVFGQAFAIVFASLQFGVELPLLPMFAVIAGLVLYNGVLMLTPRVDAEVHNRDLFASLLIDFAALTALLYCSGGATNPFVFLYVLQVTLGAILLDAWSAWSLVALTGLAFALLTRWYLPLKLPVADASRLFELYVIGALVCFVMDVVLLVAFLSRIHANLRQRDDRLADLRQQAAEEDHIVRMGLLASGAAHELGTPLATLSVLVGDWRHLPEFRDHPERAQELADMAAELQRIKGIVSGILLSAGEARGEAPALTTLARFFQELVAAWQQQHPATPLGFAAAEPLDAYAYRHQPVVFDSALRQVLFNVLENARDASPAVVTLTVYCEAGELRLVVRDEGPGFAPEMLARLGKPYQSSKGRPGGGLGLFLVVNVLRKLGGRVAAENLTGGGAQVTLTLPLTALALDGTRELEDLS